jgi:hypothetical protein
MNCFMIFSIILFIFLMLGVIVLAIVVENLKDTRHKLRAEQDKKYENEVMYDGEALTWLDKRLNHLRDNIQTTTYNEVKKSGRKLVKTSDFNRILKRFIKG